MVPIANGDDNMAVLVHHLENSRSHRVLWPLEELKVPYELKRYQRNPATRLAPLVLRQVHPLGKSPVIEDEGRVVAETGAIVEYLSDSGRLGAPANPEDALRYRYFNHYAEGSLMPPLFTKLVLGRVPLFASWCSAGSNR
jgi:glutathione S-transferase